MEKEEIMLEHETIIHDRFDIVGITKNTNNIDEYINYNSYAMLKKKDYYLKKEYLYIKGVRNALFSKCYYKKALDLIKIMDWAEPVLLYHKKDKILPLIIKAQISYWKGSVYILIAPIDKNELKEREKNTA